MSDIISNELLSAVTGDTNINLILYDKEYPSILEYTQYATVAKGARSTEINIYELAHKNLKQWAKLKNIFDIIDWSEEPEQIFKKVEKIRNEIN